MPLDLSQAEPAVVRAALPAWLAATTTVPATVEPVVLAWLDTVDDAALAGILQRLSTLGEPGGDHPADPHVRRLSRHYIAPLLAPGSGVDGLDRLHTAFRDHGGRLLLVGNHLSYVDAQLTDALLADAGAPAIADALCVVAGPKVYDTLFRRLAALGLHTIATAQASGITDRASLRELARIAGRALQAAQDHVAAGHPVLLYAEGTRSRSGRLQPFLRGAGRYAAVEGCRVLPLALDGSDAVFPVDAEQLSPAVVRVTVGEAFDPAGLSRDEVMDRARDGLIAALPAHRRPASD
ncbi:MAG: 1-acyl-sn-glycerol-3-phosphate acyltransferase [Alphaproteobacteria bacterium]|nr:1-acyl-sn-glycerol-3-phosphate acyltransferase [Alphaproteobacteria bacterium]